MRFIFKPTYWIMNNPYSRLHNLALKKLLDLHEFTDITEHTAYLGDTEIWITNNPYCVGIRSLTNTSRPSRRTIFKMNKALESAIVNKITSLND